MMRPTYEALDKDGHPYMRAAQVVSELPWAMRRAALDSMLVPIAQSVGLAPAKPLAFGLPVHHAFGLSAKDALKHSESTLLLCPAGEISLDIAPSFSSESV